MAQDHGHAFLSKPINTVLLILFLTVVPIVLIFAYYYFNTYLYPGRDYTYDGFIVLTILCFINLGISLYKNSKNYPNNSSNSNPEQPCVTTKQYLIMCLVIAPVAIGLAYLSNYLYFYLMETYSWHHNTTFKFTTSGISGLVFAAVFALIIITMTKYFDKRNRDLESKIQD